MPWVHFTGFTHPMHVGNQDSVPRIVWGKAEQKGGILTVPVGLQVHHALVDGSHAAAFYHELERLFADPERILR
jgi:chloramphenicol O-acetyltransferase type A